MDLLKSLKWRLAGRKKFPALVRRFGGWFLLDPENWVDKHVLADDFENAQIAAALRHVIAHETEIFIDIGANFGLYSIIAAANTSVSRIYAFEPVARHIAQLQGNIFANRAWDRITVFPFALGSEKGIETIHIAPKNTGTSRFDVTATGLPSEIFQETQSINVERFDDVAPFHEIVDARAFIKIDVEGHTVDVIAGMNRFLRSNICRLQIELFDRERDGVIASLQALGYEIAELIGDDHYFVKRATAR